MKFEDKGIESLDLTCVDNFSRLIIKCLCGEEYYQSFSDDDRKLIGDLINHARTNGLNYEQFNELLLLLNQDRIGKHFFKFFFEKEKITLDELRQGIIKFRGFAMLCFGNFRFAYKQLIQSNEDELRERLRPYWRKSSELIDTFERRATKMLELDKIERNDTWYLGYISGEKIKKEAKVLREEITKAERDQNNFRKTELTKFQKELFQMDKHIEEAQRKALRNTDIYLTWDYMDIYIATSMRNKWEFEDTFDFVEKVFGAKSPLNKLNLRYFDPTQSKSKNSRDKGLIEGLMLKKARCAIYLAQESDTMGKDSELAATLAQSKPVIVYVPQYKPSKYAKKIKEYPLDFFKKRFLILDTEEIFDDTGFIKLLPSDLASLDDQGVYKFEKVIDDFLSRLDQYRHDQPFSLWSEKETEFKEEYRDFSIVCKILAIAECYNFDRRADLLKGRHPLCMQVDLQTGVANGVLVVRSPSKCANLLHKILTNNMEFTIKHCDEGFTVLEEKISGSPFRVVTDYERLTNSFWNLFSLLTSDETLL
jgi:hypothetical protein